MFTKQFRDYKETGFYSLTRRGRGQPGALTTGAGVCLRMVVLLLNRTRGSRVTRSDISDGYLTAPRVWTPSQNVRD
jgi:hypothetical protein